MPLQQPIPIWLDGSSKPAYRHMGRLADGWFPQVPPGEHLAAALGNIAEAATATGRDPSRIGMKGRANWGRDGLE